MSSELVSVRGPRTAPVLLVLLAVGCAPAGGDDAASAGQAATGATCDAVIDEARPYPGQADFYWRDPLRFRFSEAVPDAEVQAPFPGRSSWSDDGVWLTYTPDQPLEPDATYTVGVSFCGGEPELEFGTSTLGSEIEDPGGLVGRTFAVDLADGVFDVGSGIAEPLSSFFSRSVLFEVMGLDGEGLSLRVGVSSASGAEQEQEQDVCFGTVELEGLDASGAPWFSFDVDDFVFGAWEGALSLLEFSLEGTVAPDGGHVGGVRYSVAVPVDQLGALLGHADASETCAFIEERGVPCESCPDEPARDCMRVAAGGLEALLVPVHLEDVGEVPADCD